VLLSVLSTRPPLKAEHPGREEVLLNKLIEMSQGLEDVGVSTDAREILNQYSTGEDPPIEFLVNSHWHSPVVSVLNQSNPEQTSILTGLFSIKSEQKLTSRSTLQELFNPSIPPGSLFSSFSVIQALHC
uniref:Uncharacterized protein n=1 Tax=Anser brachyrhynchus TaxID=132585 RepID=A0A8B9BS44_9AVES